MYYKVFVQGILIPKDLRTPPAIEFRGVFLSVMRIADCDIAKSLRTAITNELQWVYQRGVSIHGLLVTAWVLAILAKEIRGVFSFVVPI